MKITKPSFILCLALSPSQVQADRYIERFRTNK